MSISPRYTVAALATSLVAFTQAQNAFRIHNDFVVQTAPQSALQTTWAWNDIAAAGTGETNAGSTVSQGSFAGYRTAQHATTFSHAEATSSVNVGSNATEIAGYNDVSALASGGFTEGYASSTLAFEMNVSSPRGRVLWSPSWEIDSVRPDFFHSRWQSSLSLTMTNLDDGTVRTSEVFSASLEFMALDVGAGRSSWVNDHMDVSLADFDFAVLDVAMNSPFVNPLQGSLHLETGGGIVLATQGDGVFGGIPSFVGSAPVGLPIPTTYVIDYDFGSGSGFPPNVLGYRLGVVTNARGAAMTPEPGTFASLGLGTLALLRCRKGRREVGVNPSNDA